MGGRQCPQKEMSLNKLATGRDDPILRKHRKQHISAGGVCGTALCTGRLWDPGAAAVAVWCCTGKAVPEGRVTKGRDLSQSHSAFNLLQQRPCSVGSSGKLATVKKQKQTPPLHTISQKVYICKEKGTWSGLPRGAPPSIHFRLHVIQDIGQSVLHHGAPAHVTHLRGNKGQRVR